MDDSITETNSTDTTTPAPNADACGYMGCPRRTRLKRVTDDTGRTRVLCPTHTKSFLGVSS
jgi:hypothetical protein